MVAQINSISVRSNNFSDREFNAVQFIKLIIFIFNFSTKKIENDGLTGTLIPEMSNLENLRFFILEQGNTTGTIPTEFGLFDRLLVFDMDFNDLSGEIPEEMYNLSLLQQLDLNDNNLGGTLSPNIGQLTTLTFIQLDHNSFSGTIPTQLGQLNALRKFGWQIMGVRRILLLTQSIIYLTSQESLSSTTMI